MVDDDRTFRLRISVHMPVSSVNGAAAAAVVVVVVVTAAATAATTTVAAAVVVVIENGSLETNGDGSQRRPIAWLNVMRAVDGADVRLEKFKGANTTENGEATAEEATSRKCEGQLSSLMVNSCSSYKSVNSRTTEMAQEDHGPSWDNLPSVILQEIFLYLPHETRMRASQVCRNWRYTFFHPSFWKKITFVLRDEDSVLWARFLADCFSLSMHEATIHWDIPNRRYIDCISETYNLLKKISCNKKLRKLFLEFNSNAYDYSVDNENDGNFFPTLLTDSVVKIIETSNCLEALSLGCTEELTANASLILESLRLHHAKRLTLLSLASIKDDPDYYDVYNDTLLKALDNGCMQRLVIHIHGWKNDYPGTTNRAWQMFVQKNPQCELRLNLIHSYVGVKVLDTDILCSAMPLTHLKVLFCENVNIRALLRLSMWYSHTLKSLTWIDSIDRKQHMPATFDPSDPNSPDPLVLVAWKCTKLMKMIFLGHKYYRENLLAIVRLRGNTLKLLVFAKSDITSENESWHKAESITHEIQEIMGLHWMPLSDADLPMVILDPFKGDSREVIMPLVLNDQK